MTEPEPAGRFPARRPSAATQAAGLVRSIGGRAAGGTGPDGTGGLGKAGAQPPGEKPSAGKAAAGVAKSVGKEAIKGAAQGAAAGGIGAAAGAAKAVGKAAIKSRKGRTAIACTLLALFLPTIILDTMIASALSAVANLGSSAQQQAVATAEASIPGLTVGQQQAFLAAQHSTGVPWEVPAAIYYYESGPGVGLLDQPASCPATTGASGAASSGLVPLGCPPTAAAPSGVSGTSGSTPPATAGLTALVRKTKKPTKPVKKPATTTTTTRPKPRPIVYLGPMQIRRRALSFAERAQASGLTWSAGWVATRVEKALDADVTWRAGYNLADGVSFSPDGAPPMLNQSSVSAKIVRAAITSALEPLPLKGMSQTGATNIFELAQDWFVASSPSNAGYSAGLGVVCGALTGKTLSVPTPAGSFTTLGAPQLSNAAEIVAETKALGMPTAAAVIAVSTGLTESSLFDLPNSSVPGSETFPGVQWGSYSPANPPNNGTSVGVFQQQDNWGSVARRMTVSRATKTFLGHSTLTNAPAGLAQVAAWQSLPPGVAAQDVQGSAFPTRYAGWVGAADKVVGAVEGIPCSTVGAPSLASVHGIAKKIVLAAESQLGVPYVWGGGNASGPTTGLAGTPPAGFDCSGLVLYALAQVGVQVPHYSGLGGQWTVVRAAGGYTTNPSALVPGDLVFFTGSDGTKASPGHVGIVVGHDEMIDAPQTGQDVSYASFAPGTGFATQFVGGGPAW